jgi:hypothetical protein
MSEYFNINLHYLFVYMLVYSKHLFVLMLKQVVYIYIIATVLEAVYVDLNCYFSGNKHCYIKIVGTEVKQ